jgi:hypothetical protein
MSPYDRSRADSGEWEKPFWQQRGWLIAAVFFAGLIVLSAALAIRGGGSGSESSPPPLGSDSATGGDSGGNDQEDSGSDTGGDARPAGCETDDSDQSLPTAPPADLEWRNVDTTVIPVSDTAGPMQSDGAVWSCFAHTPMGAVLAAHTVYLHLGYDGWEDVAEQQMTPEEYVPAFFDWIYAEGLPSDETRVPSAGFSVLSYDPERATVSLLLGDQRFNDQYVALTMTMEWVDGDWKAVIQSDGSLGPQPAVLNGTNGYTTWES